MKKPVRWLDGVVGEGCERLFRRRSGPLEPVDIIRAVQNKVCNREWQLLGRVFVPNRVEVRIPRADFETLVPLLDELRADCIRQLEEVVKSRGYLLKGPIDVQIREDADRPSGDPEIRVRVAEGERATPAATAAPSTAVAVAAPPAGGGGRKAPPRRALGPAELRLAGRSTAIDRPDPVPLGMLARVGSDGGHPVTEATTLVIGRDPDCDIVVDEKIVSARHARIEGRASGVWVYDLESLNGTRVGGRKVLSVRLADGDRLRIGRSEFVFRAGDDATRQKRRA